MGVIVFKIGPSMKGLNIHSRLGRIATYINPFTDGINLIEISVWADDLKLTSQSTLGLAIKASTTLWHFIQLCTAPRSMLGYFMLL